MHCELSYALTSDDLYEFQRASPTLSKSMPAPGKKEFRLGRTFWWVLLVLVAVGLFFLFRDDQVPSADGQPIKQIDPIRGICFDIGAWGLILFFFWYFLWRHRISKSAAKKAFEKDPRLGDAHLTSASDEGVTFKNATASSAMAWTHFIHFAETQNLFVLMIAEHSVQLIPKRAFLSPEQLDEFRQFALAHIGKPIGFPVQPPSPTMPR